MVFTPVEERRGESDPAAVLAFRRFRLFPASRSLTADGREVDIGGRAFDLLRVLLEARGTVVDKAEIMRKVWPSTLVDESNLRFQMAKLRQIPGRERHVIKTVAGSGYPLAHQEARPQPAVPHRSRAFSADERLRMLERENNQLRQALADVTIGRLLHAVAPDVYGARG
ncbi:winged helix-turn-helix domain-containing protein, partial [Nostoc sp. NIES-2111]